MTAWAVTFVLVLGRVGGLFALLPLMNTLAVPRWASALIALVLSGLLTLNLPPVAVQPDVAPLVLAFVREVFLGLAFGLGVQAAFAALSLGAEIMSTHMAMAMTTIADPLTRSSGSAIGTLASWLGGLVFFQSGLLGRCLEVVAASFYYYPPGQAPFVAGAAPAAIEAVGRNIALGVQLAGPVATILWLVHLFVALLAKLAPRMQVFFSLGVTITSVVGIAMFGMALPWILSVHATAVSNAIDTFATSLAGP